MCAYRTKREGKSKKKKRNIGIETDMQNTARENQRKPEIDR